MATPKLDAPRGVLHPTRAGLGGAIHHERFLPTDALAPFIEHTWSVSWDLRGEPPFLAETLPHPSVHVIFERGSAQVHGLSTSRFSRRLTGVGRVFGIKFRPATFGPLLGAPLSRITNERTSLRAVFGADALPFAREILATSDASSCAALTDAFLVGRLGSLPAPLRDLRDLVERLARDSSITSVEQAAALVGLPLRALQRAFRDDVGVPAKWVIKRYRLHEAAAQLARDPSRDLARLAVELGYFDQPHFSRDFKAFVGRTPREFVRAHRS